MNLDEHPIYRDIYNLCGEIENLPASENATKLVVMASDLNKPVSALIEALKAIKLVTLTAKDGPSGLSRITRICINAGITQHLDELQSK